MLRDEVAQRVEHYNAHARMSTGREFQVGRRPESLVASLPEPNHESTAFWDYPMTLDYVVDLAINVSMSWRHYGVIVDTGSSNLALALAACSCGAGSDDLEIETVDECIEVIYGSGAWAGRKTVSVDVGFVEGTGEALTVSTPFAGILVQEDFFTGGGYQGILGLGYPALAQGYSSCLHVLGETDAATPLLDVMNALGRLNSNVFALTFCNRTATFTIGGVEADGPEVSFVDVQMTYGQFYGYYLVYLESVYVDGSALAVEAAQLNAIGGVLVDSGTTLIYLPEAATTAIETAVSDAATTELSTTFFDMDDCIDNLAGLPDIALGLDGYSIVLDPSEYTLFYGGCYYWGIGSSDVGIIGNIALQNKMVVFDRDSNQVGFANVDCGEASTDLATDGSRVKSDPLAAFNADPVTAFNADPPPRDRSFGDDSQASPGSLERGAALAASVALVASVAGFVAGKAAPSVRRRRYELIRDLDAEI